MKRWIDVANVVLIFAVFFCGCQKTPEKQPVAKPMQQQEIKDPDVGQLIVQLTSNDPDTQIKAAKELEKLGPKAEAAILPLLNALKSRNMSVCFATEKALISIGEKAAAAIVLQDDVNSKMTSILREIGQPAVPLIIAELKKPISNEKQMSLLFCLGSMEKKAILALPELKTMAAREKNRGTKQLIELTIVHIEQGMAGLKALTEKHDTSLKKSEQRLKELRQEMREMADKIIEIKAEINAPGADLLMKSLSTDDDDKALAQLKPLLSNNDMESRANALICLGRLGKNPANKAKAIPLLEAGLSDQESTIRTIAALLLTQLGQKEKATDVLLATIANPSNGTEIVFSLMGLVETEIAVKDPKALTTLGVLVGAPEVKIAGAAGIVLINSQAEEKVVPVAAKMLRSIDKEKRMVGAVLLFKSGKAAQQVYADIKSAQRRETSSDLKVFLDMLLGSIEEPEDNSTNAILARLKSPQHFVRIQAVMEMEKLNSAEKRKILPGLMAIIKTGDKNTKSLLITHVCQFGKDAEPALSDLIALLEEGLKEGNESQQFMITRCLGKINNPKAAPTLIKVLKHGKGHSAMTAAIALKDLGPKAKAVVPDLMEMLKDPQVCDEALGILAKTDPLETEEQANTIIKLLEGDIHIAYSAAFTLSDIGYPKAIPGLIKMLDSTNESAQFLTVDILGEIAKTHSDPRIIPAVQSLRDKNPAQRVQESIEKFFEKVQK